MANLANLIVRGMSHLGDVSASTVTADTFVGTATKAAQDESGNNIKDSYAASIEAGNGSIVLKNKNGDTLSSVPVSVSDTWIPLTGATASANGSVGYINAVPPKDGYNTKYFRADGTWSVPPNTHYTTGLVTAGSASATANAATSNNSIYLNVLDDSTVRSSHNIVGAGTVEVSSDANGKITITGTDQSANDAVTQTISSTSNADYRVLFSGSADDTTKTEGVRKDTDFKYNPSTNTLTVGTVAASLSGNATSATKATNDSDDNPINTTYIKASQKGANSGVAPLNASGKIDTSYLPSFVDDVLEYSAKSNFPSTGETGKIYVDTGTNLTYRWSGSAYVEISPSLALGTTSSTAFRGDYGNTAYAHATDANRLTTATSSGFYKIAATANGHVQSLTAVAASDITGKLGDTAVNRAIADESGNNIKSNYAASFSISDHTITLKNKSGTSLGTVTVPDNDTWTAMVGATSSADGSVGYVNAKPPKDGYNTKYLRADGTWSVPPNDNTHWTTGLITAGAADATANAAVTNNSVYLNILDNSTVRNSHNIVGTGSVTVNSDANGKITINGTDNNNAVTQTATSTSADYEVLFSSTADNTSRTEGARKNSNLKFNPSTGNLQVTQINGVTVGTSPKFTDNNTWNAMTGATASANGTVGYVNAVPPKDGYNTKYLRADGTWSVPPDNNTWTAMTGATSSANGTVGYVNAVPPKDGYNTKYLRADGTWAVPPDNNTTYGLSISGHTVSIVAGGTTTSVTVPDNNDNNAVTQTATTTNSDYEVLFSGTADNTSRTEGARKNSNITFNPSTGNLKVTQINGVTVGSSPKFTDNNTWTAMVGATSSANGSVGYINSAPPKDGYNTKYWRADGTWAAPPNTHYTTAIYAGTGTAANASTTNGSTKITVADDTTARGSVTLKGTGATTVTSDANGVVTINSTDNNTTYGLSISGHTVSLVAGGTTSSVTVPDNNDNNAVTQTISSTSNADYRVLFSSTADDTTRTEGTRKDTDFKYNPSTNTLTVGTVSGSLSGNATSATKATQDASGNTITSTYKTVASLKSKGGVYQPIYFDSSGNAQNTTYTLNATVPSNAVFTDTKNTAGSTNSDSKLFLVGATSQAANPQTYSDADTYVTNGTLRTGKLNVIDKVTLEYNTTTNALNFTFA